MDLALPGTLPVLNRGAVERAIRLGPGGGRQGGAAVDLRAQELLLPRPAQGLPDQPVRDSGGAGRASVEFMLGERPQEDRAPDPRAPGRRRRQEPARGLRTARPASTSTVPARRCLEIVSEPEMRSSAEAVEYAKALHALVVWLGVCDGNMQEGSFRCDANVSRAPARRTLRHAARDQEPQQLPLPAAGHRFRESSGRSTVSKTA